MHALVPGFFLHRNSSEIHPARISALSLFTAEQTLRYLDSRVIITPYTQLL